MSSVDAIMAVIAAGRGERPASLHDAETERVLGVALALLVELGVSNERIDRLEREVAMLRGITRAEVVSTPLDAAAAEERGAAMEALILRALHGFIDPRQPG